MELSDSLWTTLPFSEKTSKAPMNTEAFCDALEYAKSVSGLHPIAKKLQSAPPEALNLECAEFSVIYSVLRDYWKATHPDASFLEDLNQVHKDFKHRTDPALTQRINTKTLLKSAEFYECFSALVRLYQFYRGNRKNDLGKIATEWQDKISTELKINI